MKALILYFFRNFGMDGNPLIHKNLASLIPYYPGGIYGLWMGAYYTVIVSNTALAHEVMVRIRVRCFAGLLV